MLAKMTSKNQITLPKKIADRFAGVKYFEIEADNGRISLTPFQPDRSAQVHEKLAALGIGESDVDDAVKWSRTSDTA